MTGRWTELIGDSAFFVFVVSLLMHAVIAARLNRDPEPDPIVETREDRRA